MYDKLREQIFIWRRNNRGCYPSMIVMHPKTYMDIEKEIGMLINFNSDGKRPYPYKGIEILRSYDLEPEIFKIG